MPTPREPTSNRVAPDLLTNRRRSALRRPNMKEVLFLRREPAAQKGRLGEGEGEKGQQGEKLNLLNQPLKPVVLEGAKGRVIQQAHHPTDLLKELGQQRRGRSAARRPAKMEVKLNMGKDKTSLNNRDVEGEGTSYHVEARVAEREGTSPQLPQVVEKEGKTRLVEGEGTSSHMARVAEKEGVTRAVEEEEMSSPVGKGGEMSISKEKLLGEEMHSPKVRDPNTTYREVTMEPLNLRPHGQLKDKGKMVVQLLEGEAPRKIVCVASSLSSTTQGGRSSVRKQQQVAAEESLVDENEPSMGRAERIGKFMASTTRSQVSGFMDMANEEELDELEKQMSLEPFSRKDKKKYNKKNKGRSRQK